MKTKPTIKKQMISFLEKYIDDYIAGEKSLLGNSKERFKEAERLQKLIKKK